MAKPSALAVTGIASLAFLVGLFPCLMTAGPALFADGPMSERFVVLGIGVLVLFALGLLGGALAPRFFRLIGIWLAAPTVPVVMFFAVAGELEGEFLLLGAAFVAAYFAAALLGSWLGARLRTRGTRDASASEPRV